MGLPSCNSHNFLGLAANGRIFDLDSQGRRFRWLFPASERSVVRAPRRRPAMNGCRYSRVPTVAESVLLPPTPEGMHRSQNPLPVPTARPNTPLPTTPNTISCPAHVSRRVCNRGVA